MSLVSMRLNLLLFVLQDGEPTRFLLIRDRIGQVQSRGVRSRRIFEGEDTVVLDFIQQVKSFVEVGFGLAREAYDDVGGDADLAFCGLHPGGSVLSRWSARYRARNRGDARW